MIYSYLKLCLLLNHPIRHQHQKERRGGEKRTSRFVRNSDVSDDTKLVEEVLKQYIEALGKMTPTGIGWAEVAESLSRPRVFHCPSETIPCSRSPKVSK